MFSYDLPNGGLNTKTFVTKEGQIKFDPALYEQRYTTTVRIIEDPRWRQSLKKIVDFGCSEMRLLPLLRRIPKVEHILAVDIDEKVLSVFQQRAVPLVSDYLHKREEPLRIEVLKGSITDSVEQLRNVDVVIGLEIIEHLHADVLEKVPDNIFGFVQPKLAIFSTPNSEFNVFFDSLLGNGFRHFDHKFEWSRAEFRAWTDNICHRYPNYSVAFLGLGNPPDEKRDVEDVGFATQMALFARNDLIKKPLATDLNGQSLPLSGVKYKEIYTVDFPYYKDERTQDEKIWCEAQYFINRYRYATIYFNVDRHIYQLPWLQLMDFARKENVSQEELLDILRNHNIQVEGNFIIMPEYDDDDDDHGLCYELNDLNLELNNEYNNQCGNGDAASTAFNIENAKDDSEECWD
ncbi:hen1 methyltransferase isoform 1-T9 [Glossina fuscipes fuscipes]